MKTAFKDTKTGVCIVIQNLKITDLGNGGLQNEWLYVNKSLYHS